MIRAFIAVEIGKKCQDSLGRAIEKLRAFDLPIRWVRPQLLHVTLKFLGDVQPESVPAIPNIMRAAVGGIEPFQISIDRIGAFPPKGRPRVIFAEVENPGGELCGIHEILDRDLAAELGIKKDGRTYTPHITIGRAGRKPLRVEAQQLADRLSSSEFGAVNVKSIVLMSSSLTPSGPLYAVMDTVSF